MSLPLYSFCFGPFIFQEWRFFITKLNGNTYKLYLLLNCKVYRSIINITCISIKAALNMREMHNPKYDPHNMRRGALNGKHGRIVDRKGHLSPLRPLTWQQAPQLRLVWTSQITLCWECTIYRKRTGRSVGTSNCIKALHQHCSGTFQWLLYPVDLRVRTKIEKVFFFKWLAESVANVSNSLDKPGC